MFLARPLLRGQTHLRVHKPWAVEQSNLEVNGGGVQEHPALIAVKELELGGIILQLKGGEGGQVSNLVITLRLRAPTFLFDPAAMSNAGKPQIPVQPCYYQLCAPFEGLADACTPLPCCIPPQQMPIPEPRPQQCPTPWMINFKPFR